jgi:hypothetical protein
MTIAERRAAEKVGGWLPVFVRREEKCVVTHEPVGALACIYCGFGKGDGHDYACRYVHFQGEVREGEEGTMVLVPAGGLPASESFF